MQNAPTETDVMIVGAGPVGIFAVFACGMLKMRCHVADSLSAIGGQCRALYPEKPIYDIPGYPRIEAGSLIDRLEEQAAPFSPVYHLNHQVTGYARDGDTHIITLSGGETIHARAVILAAGAGAFGPNRPPIDGLAAYEDKSVFYMVNQREDFRGKKVMIAGGGDSAIDWALSLADIAEKIYVVHRRDNFRAAPESVDRLHQLARDSNGRAELVIPFQLRRLVGNNGHLRQVVVASLDNEERVLDADALLSFFGLTPSLGPLTEWGLNIAHHHIPVEPTTCQTCLPGVFAIGDVAAYPNKLKLILTGFAEAEAAAHSAYGLVFPGQALHFEYSTSKGLPA